ncbi:MAG: two-component system, OmpR family, sensor histidine kinase KdpD [Thermomicrobiales bacterium]|jgi:two-component system sensor histidine kinase KdpD|nr:two-component system, OmpR family, sensor histidine kinase KdpD [Thermomicrobiales bacterium]
MTEPERPDPDGLLRRYGFAMRQEEHVRGRLRVYLGAAPGVGKTYTMLQEGRRLKGGGHDVVVGIVETHGRAETEAQLGDLDVIPRRRIDYRGVAVEEMDTDAILRRKPEIVLVDELAHTNAPGSPREKRWQDVEVLRDASIDVIATLNIQHLESLNDVVASITGVQVRETIPDRILDDATEVQLVDLPVEGLLERLEQGKVYPAERASQALEHFFRPGNLTALRELALRRTAAGVDERLEGYMREHAIEAVWPAAERIIVLVTDHPAIGQVIRRAWRLADGLRAELVAVAVVPPGGIDTLPEARRHALKHALEFAEDLGALPRIVEGQRVAPALAALVNEENVSTVVLGHAPASGWRRRIGKPLADELLELVDNVAVQLVEVKST